MANHISNPVPVRSSRKSSIRRSLVIAEQVVLYTLIVGAIGFYLGSQHQANANEAFEQAVKAAAPTPSPVPKS